MISRSKTNYSLRLSLLRGFLTLCISASSPGENSLLKRIAIYHTCKYLIFEVEQGYVVGDIRILDPPERKYTRNGLPPEQF